MRGQADFDGAHQLGGVVGVNARRRSRVKPLEQPVQPGFSVFCPAAFQALPQLLVPLGRGKKPFGQRAQIKPGSAGHDGKPAPAGNLPERRPRLAAVFASGKGLVRVGHVDEVMRQPCPLFFGRLGCPQVHAAIDGHRVATNDFAAKLFTQRKGKCRLAAARRPQQQHGQRIDRRSSRSLAGG